tara:strand:+ start:2666 stop:3379 length:714 start_codon:yes stop_codon:yes gene_type:complete
MSSKDKSSLFSNCDPTAFVIQARMNSSRLPGKVLYDFCGKPMLKFQIDLLRKNDLGIDIVVATSNNSENDKIEKLCVDSNIDCVRGDEENVLKRFSKVAELLGLRHIIRLTGDNPLPSLDVIKSCVETHLRAVPDLTSTRQVMKDCSVKRYIPKGLSVDILNCKTLLLINQNSLNDFEKENVIPVFFRQEYNVEIICDYDIGLPELSVDTLEDYERVSTFTRDLLKNGRLLSTLGYQ